MFRSPAEVQKMYEERAEHGMANAPYIVDIKGTKEAGNRLFFFGSVHSTDPHHTQWKKLNELWHEFEKHKSKNKQKIVFYEGRMVADTNITQEEALARYGESGIVTWRALKEKIRVESPEPDRSMEVRYIRQKFSIQRVVIYYFARQMLQWERQDYQIFPDWEKYADGFLADYNTLPVWDGIELNLKTVLEWYQAEAGKEFDPHDVATVYKLSDPYQSEVSAISGQVRDTQLFEAIRTHWQRGEDIFVIYGSSHAMTLEPALQTLAVG